MDVLILLAGILVGGVFAWFLAKFKFQSNQGLSISEIEAKYVSKELYVDAKRELFAANQKLTNFNQKIASQEQIIIGYREKLDHQKGELEDLQIRFRTEFKNLANELLEEKSRKFTILNEEKISAVLNPLKERIVDFKARVEETYSQDIRERASLKKEIEQLLALNRQVSDDAIRLTNALKGDSKIQGDWGEVQLEMILEKAGLIKNIHYRSQSSFTDDTGNQKRPDYIIHLPENKHLVVDAKVSLTAYNSYFNATDTYEQQQMLSEHISSIYRHVKSLSEKNYQGLYQINQPDYVIMFIPIEPALSLIAKEDSSIFEKCLDKNIVLVSTSTLLATLRTISYIWKQENQKRNVVKIAKESGKLYDKFVNFTEDLLVVGKQLDSAKRSYRDAMNKLVDGQGNLVKKVEDIRKMGINTSKSINPQLLDRSVEDE